MISHRFPLSQPNAETCRHESSVTARLSQPRSAPRRGKRRALAALSLLVLGSGAWVQPAGATPAAQAGQPAQAGQSAQTASASARVAPMSRVRVCVDANGAVSRIANGAVCNGTSTVWSGRVPAPQLCWDTSSLVPSARTRVLSVRSANGCGPQQQALSSGARLLCADGVTGVLRWPVTGLCAEGNVATTVLVGSGVFAQGSGGGRASTPSVTTTTVRSTTPTSTPAAVSAPRAPVVGVVSTDDARVRFTIANMSPDTGVYAVQWVVQGESFNTYQMRRSTTPTIDLDTSSFGCNRTYTFRVFVMASSWQLADGHSTQNVTPHSEPFNVTMTHPCNTGGGGGGGGPSCAAGGVCVVGDTGPGGGIVFYVHDDADDLFTSVGSDCYTQCRYLEVAPVPGAGEIRRTWSTGANQSLTVTGADGTAIGTGYQNSVDIRNQSGNVAATSAAVYALEYSNGGKSDWHLPSRRELHELCKYARFGGTGDVSVDCGAGGSLRPDFESFEYWSSTENSNLGAEVIDFSSGFQQNFSKAITPEPFVRPIRAFGSGTITCATGGACAVGDTGPGGGIVFYVHPTGSFTSTGSDCGTTCAYLEAAPSDQAVSDWCSSTNALLSVTATAIGSGMANTTTAATTCTSGAIQVAADYSNNGKTDWHLPSQGELNELCKYARNTGQAAGVATVCSGGSGAEARGFTSMPYWSSSEVDAINAWRQSFLAGGQFSVPKNNSSSVRPIRAL